MKCGPSLALTFLSWQVSNGFLLSSGESQVQEGPTPIALYHAFPGVLGHGEDGSAKDAPFYLGLSVCPQQRDPALNTGSRI